METITSQRTPHSVAQPDAAGAPTLSLRELLQARQPAFWAALRAQSANASSYSEAAALSTLRKRALKNGFAEASDSAPETLRLAILSGYSTFPLHDLMEHCLATSLPAGTFCETYVGDYDNYVAEILGERSAFHDAAPQVVFFAPSLRQSRYSGSLQDSRDKVEAQAKSTVGNLLDLCRIAHERTGAEILLANFPLPARFDPGSFRGKTLASEWSFTKFVNLELGLAAPAYVHICDVEFLSARRGTLACSDERGWFQSKQMCAPELQLDIAREVAHIVASLRRGPAKVAVLDLDNTLWGGVVGDDGLEGIEIGSTSSRGEAFQAFQRYLQDLSCRGILLAVCSKNDRDKALEPFERHPEMVLCAGDFVSFQANWEPKSENIRRIAREIGVGLDSLVFIDDNPAETEIVRQFLPEVRCVTLGADPALYVAQVQDARLFEPKTITAEDSERAALYKLEADRQKTREAFTDMAAYLNSLEMKATIAPFRALDVPRIAQLINRSNQFNLTTRRRTEAEVETILGDPNTPAFTIRLRDRFGDHGLVGVVIGKVERTELERAELEIDTWVMSCRVLQRQLEEETANAMVRVAAESGCNAIRGVYLPTQKNGMVRDRFAELGFTLDVEQPDRREFVLQTQSWIARQTAIQVTTHSDES